MTDLVSRLRRWTHAVDAQPASDLMEEAAGEIERLQSLTRFQDRVIRSGDTATLTESEREAVNRATVAYELLPTEGAKQVAATLIGLLDRLGGGR